MLTHTMKDGNSIVRFHSEQSENADKENEEILKRIAAMAAGMYKSMNQKKEKDKTA